MQPRRRRSAARGLERGRSPTAREEHASSGGIEPTGALAVASRGLVEGLQRVADGEDEVALDGAVEHRRRGRRGRQRRRGREFGRVGEASVIARLRGRRRRRSDARGGH